MAMAVMLNRGGGYFVDRFDFPRRVSMGDVIKELAQQSPVLRVGNVQHREFHPEDQGAGGLAVAVTAFRPLGRWHITYNGTASATMAGIVPAREVEAAFRGIADVQDSELEVEVRRFQDRYELTFTGPDAVTVVNDGTALTIVESPADTFRIPFEPESTYLAGTYATAESVGVTVTSIVANTDGTGTDLVEITGAGDAALTFTFDGATTAPISADATTCEIQSALADSFPSTTWRVERTDRHKWLVHRTKFDPAISDPIKQFGCVDVPQGATDVYVPWTFETVPEEAYFTAAQNDSDLIGISPDWSTITKSGITLNLDSATTVAGMRVYWFALAAAKSINFDGQGEVDVVNGNDLEITHGLSEEPGFITLTVESPSGELYQAWPVASTVDDTSFTIRWDGTVTSATVRWAVFSSGVQRVAKATGVVSVSEEQTEITVPFSNVLTGDPVAVMLELKDTATGDAYDIGIDASVTQSNMEVELSGAAPAGKELHYVVATGDSDALNPSLGAQLKAYSKSYGVTGTPTISDVSTSTQYRLKVTNVDAGSVLYNQVTPGNIQDLIA